MNRMSCPLIGLLLLASAPSVVIASWSLGSPAAEADLEKNTDIVSGGMTDQPSTAYSVYLQVGFTKYDQEFDTSPAMGAMWSHTIDASPTEPHDCPVTENAVFVLYANGGVQEAHAVDMYDF